MTLASPCVGTCRLDQATGYCLGCARTGDEIARWRGQTSHWRRAIWDALPSRLLSLGVTCRRLSWETDEILDFVAHSLRQATGTWVVGVVGAVAEFTARPGESIAIEREGARVTATTPGGKLRFRIDDQVRALTFDPDDTPEKHQKVVLAVKRERGGPPVSGRIADLGPDSSGIDLADQHHQLFDLGLDRKEARFCIRCASGAVREAISAATGTTLAEAAPRLAPVLLRDSPARVVESALGRIEVSTPIPPPGGASPPGPHTHLLPEHLATGRALPVGMDLPPAYLPGAVFYPAK